MFDIIGGEENIHNSVFISLILETSIFLRQSTIYQKHDFRVRTCKLEVLGKAGVSVVRLGPALPKFECRSLAAKVKKKVSVNKSSVARVDTEGQRE